MDGPYRLATSNFNVTINKDPNEMTQENVSFADQTQSWTYSVQAPYDDLHQATDSSDADLANFFSRPIKISDITWGVNNTCSQTINPWSLYFNNNRVINRISNYNLLRAKLCVRFMINGNGFHYGRVLVSYRPLHDSDDFGQRRFLIDQDIIPSSQKMHVYLDPTKSQGGTLCLPFAWTKNALSVVNAEWAKMGELDIGSITNLYHANGGTDNVTISVFAWAEDVSLSMPTIVEPTGLAPQLGEVFNSQMAQTSDEYEKDGPISKPAATIARAAGALTDVPTIGRYARATQMAANAVGGVARLFGMSRPPVISDVEPYRPTYLGNLANTNVPDSVTKLTLDVKQELTIDPGIVGVGSADEMSIQSIAQRESYLTQFDWVPSAAPETLLWNSRVTPISFDSLWATPTEAKEYMMTPMCFAALPFKHWRGTLKYRFQVVASSFHKGRLKIVYDPYFNLGTEYNTQYTQIIDLAHERDFTVEVKWGQEWTFLETDNPFTTGKPFSTTSLGTARHGFSNGVIAVYVVNELTTPSVSADPVPILVSVSAGDDFEVVGPDASRILGITYFKPPASASSMVASPPSDVYRSQMAQVSGGGTNNPDADNTQDESAPESGYAITSMAAPISPTDNALLVYYGDPIASFRQLLKRYNVHTCYVSDKVLTTDGHVDVAAPNFPEYRGHAKKSLYNSSAPVDPTPYVYARTTLLNYLAPAFLAWKGGLRNKYVYESAAATRGLMSLIRASTSIDCNLSALEKWFGDHSQVLQSLYSATSGQFHNGGHATIVELNPVLEVELPYYSNERFSPCRSLETFSSTSGYDKHEVRFPKSPAAAAGVTRFVSVGEDFGLYFFQSVPRIYADYTDPIPSATA